MTKVKITVVTVVSLISITFLTLILLWSAGIYLPWTRAPEGVNSRREMRDYCLNQITRPIQLEFYDEVVSISTEEIASIDIRIDKSSFKEFILGIKPVVYSTVHYNQDNIRNKLSSIYVKSQDAYISLDIDGKFHLNKEVMGRDFDIDLLANDLEQYVKTSSSKISMKKYLKKPSITEKDLLDKYDSIKWVNDWKISYTSGLNIDSKFLYSCWDSSYSIDLNKLNISSILNDLENFYNTADKEIDFTTSSGNSIKTKYNTFGIKVYRNKETEFIKNTILSKESVTDRVPETYGFDGINGTYIEVSIDRQHLWHYRNSSLCCESDCVTGMRNKHDTTTGVFYISEKINGKILIGEDYSTYVNKWLRLNNQGIGLHDAYWRSKFGDTVYYSGSHGCINLPKSFAYKLYDEVDIGIPVIVY